MDGAVPVLRASFKMTARRNGDKFYFSSAFFRNTADWHVKNEGNFSCYYTSAVNWDKVNEYIKKAKEFDKKLHAPVYTTYMYFCGNLPNLLQLLGVEYKTDYNGITHDNFSSFENNGYLDIIGGNEAAPAVLDIHDLWHARLHHVVDIAIINRPVDEGCAYLYGGGSWGYSWDKIFKEFKAFMGTDKDWLTAYNEHKNFCENKHTPLYTDYLINALIVRQIEREKGFGAVVELLNCGKKEADNANYFRALDKIAGINKDNFNERVGKLVGEESVK